MVVSRADRVVGCKAPIDSWREVTIRISITSADSTQTNNIRVVIKRDGCKDGSFYHNGRCKFASVSSANNQSILTRDIVLIPSIPLKNPYKRPVYSPLYNFLSEVQIMATCPPSHRKSSPPDLFCLGRRLIIDKHFLQDVWFRVEGVQLSIEVC